MKIRQAYVSKSIQAFKQRYLTKFSLTEYRNGSQPVVMFGLYEKPDYDFYLRYRGSVTVVWCGSDSGMITPQRADIIKSRTARHIVKSNFQSVDMKRWQIAHDVIPVTWQIPEGSPVPLGDSIYFYGNKGRGFYGEEYLPEIKRHTGLPIIETYYGKYSPAEMKSIYSRCFIGLRLTKHDGIPNTVLELGILGRRCIYNGNLPNAIGWFNLHDICANIESENRNRDLVDVNKVSQMTKDFINITDDWLNV